MNREVSKKMKASKARWTEEQCKNIEKKMMSENIKEAYPQGSYPEPTA